MKIYVLGLALGLSLGGLMLAGCNEQAESNSAAGAAQTSAPAEAPSASTATPAPVPTVHPAAVSYTPPTPPTTTSA